MSNQTTPYAGRHFIMAIILICTTVLADQISKWAVMEKLLVNADKKSGFFNWFFSIKTLSPFFTERPEFKTETLTSWLDLVLVWNQGISFGMFDTNNPKMALVFIFISLLICLSLLIWMALVKRTSTAMTIALIIGGAIGNIIDRMRFSAVVDFIDIHYAGYHWPAFNIADSCIVAGAFFLALQSFMTEHHTNTGEKK